MWARIERGREQSIVNAVCSACAEQGTRSSELAPKASRQGRAANAPCFYQPAPRKISARPEKGRKKKRAGCAFLPCYFISRM